MLNCSGITCLDAPIGGHAPVVSLTTDAAGGTDLNGSLITATTVDLADDVVLTTNVTINATTASFHKTINADSAANGRILRVNASGLTTFAGAVGNNQALLSLTTDAAGSTDLNGSPITATMVRFADDVVLTTDVTINATRASFRQTVNADSAANDRALTVNASGLTTFAGAVGTDQALFSLATDAPGATNLRGSPINASTVDFADAVVLTTDVAINATTARFHKTINADSAANGRTLIVNATGLTTFAGAVGDDQPLLSLTTDHLGTTDLNGSLINATTVDFADDVVLTADVTINAATASFRQTVNADLAANNRTLTVNTSGLTTFAGAVGSDQALLSLITDAAWQYRPQRQPDQRNHGGFRGRRGADHQRDDQRHDRELPQDDQCGLGG